MRERRKKKARSYQSGTRNGRAKLNEEKVIQLLRDFKTGDYNYIQIGDRYEINRTTATNIIKGKLWKGICRENI